MNKKNAEKIQTNWPVPAQVKDSFVDFCRKTGTIAQDDVAGALIVWQHLPAEIREHAKLVAKGLGKFDDNAFRKFLEE